MKQINTKHKKRFLCKCGAITEDGERWWIIERGQVAEWLRQNKGVEVAIKCPACELGKIANSM